ncbi:hypothetical protein SEPCBS119000_001434 [Sporothrix epigloea]|uniref:CID domain-containing protein n=1 Tax=Sporothrix epigloea TaxID=1892477 RepID=A0ABP0DCB2_9PEZI
MAATTAAAELAIAKASLAAVLLRPDPVSCSRTEIDEYARQLATTAARCSPANVQTCKRWMLQHVTSSPARTAAVGRFLVALANSFSPTASPPGVENGEAEKRSIKQTSGRRKRLHLLYIVNDVLYHVTFRDNGINGSARPAFASSIEPFIEPLVASAASFARAPKQVSKIRRLLDLWAEKHYLSENVLARLRAAVDQGPRLAEENLGKKNISSIQSTSVPASVGTSKEAPFHLPALHGDPSTPWYDLPAANWLAILEPNSTRPMNPATLKPLSMTPGPAPPSLVASVQALLADVSRMFDEEFESHAGGLKDTEIELDVNALGERIQVDVPSGDVVGGDTYYGWSRAFCKSMKEGQKRQPVASGTDLDLPDAVVIIVFETGFQEAPLFGLAISRAAR